MVRRLIAVALAGMAAVAAAGCGGGRRADPDVTPVAPVAAADGAASVQQQLVNVVKAVSPSVVQIRTPEDLGSARGCRRRPATSPRTWPGAVAPPSRESRRSSPSETRSGCARA